MKEKISGFSHLIGALLSIVGIVFLLINSKSITETVSFLIFGLTALLLYTASAVYHLFKKPDEEVGLLRKLDHASIYLLIAGTFAPFCLVVVKGIWGISVFISVCVLAIAGISISFIKSVWKLPRWLLTSFYIFMGLVGLTLIYPMKEYHQIVTWLIIGGSLYLMGAIIYIIKKPNISKYFGFHELFHFFILGGTFSHFFCIYKFIALG
ncbi:hemolysin III family protein [Candidatus Parcubacteria bacterium]|nr:hemolysin III family protein [Candidatus Parcubacteria bacterium]